MIPVFRPTIKRKDMESTLNNMVADQIGPGNTLQEFEALAAQYLGVAGATAFSSYYLAVILALEALELQAGDAVVISALAPQLHYYILQKKGLHALVLDVNPDSGLVDAAEIEKVLPQNPKAILYHYTLGYLPVKDEILKFGIPVIEDISHCIGAAGPDNKRFGAFGDLAVLSLKPHDIITTAEGGLLFSREKKFHQKIKALLEQTQDNLLLSDLNAGLGITQLKSLDSFLEKRRNIQTVYTQSLMKSHYKSLLQQAELEKVPYSFPVVITSGLKEVQKYCRKKNVDTVQAFTNALIGMNEGVQATCKNAKTLLMCTLLFPLYPMLGREQINTISKVIGTIP